MIRAFMSTEMPSILMTVGCDRMEAELSLHVMAIFSLLLRNIVSCSLFELQSHMFRNVKVLPGIKRFKFWVWSSAMKMN